MTRQDQRADAGGLAVQAGRDVTISSGVSTSEMKEILANFQAESLKFQAQAFDLGAKRMEDFAERVTKRFASNDRSRAEAFADPDFQYELAQAQVQAARTDDASSVELLVDLLARRSLETERSRLSLSLNAAIERASLLTRDEINEITWAFQMLNTIHHGVTNINELASYLKSHIRPFSEVSSSQSSYQHIVATGCGTLEPLNRANFFQVLKSTYPNATSAGFTIAELESLLPDGQKNKFNGIIQRTAATDAERYTFVVPKMVIQPLCETNQPPLDVERFLPQLVSRNPMTDEDLKAKLLTIDPELSVLIDRWQNTSLPVLRLTNVGMAIALANLSGKKIFEPNINSWIN